ncbi:MAG: contractile injection system protein, VgrG/Pvc8 family [Acidobacteriota bacterium]
MTDLFSSKAPVFKVDGQVRGELARDVSSLEIDESTDGLKTMVLRLIAEGPRDQAEEEQQLYLDGAIVAFGKDIEVSIGPSDDARIIFTGTISAIEATFSEGGEPHVTVFAEDRLMTLRMTRHIKTWEHVTDADMATAIASANGLNSDAAAPGPTYDVVQQWNQSDLAFLRERARLIQAEIWFENDTLCFKSRGQRTATALTLVQGRDLLHVRVRADLAHQRTRVTTSGYDASARDSLNEEADSDAVDAEISGGRTGPAVLQQAFGPRASFRVRDVPIASIEASAWARADMLRRARSFVTALGTTDGSPNMVVGSRLTLDRVGTPFSGDGYYVVHVSHTYNLTSGYRTHFEAQRATISGA